LKVLRQLLGPRPVSEGGEADLAWGTHDRLLLHPLQDLLEGGGVVDPSPLLDVHPTHGHAARLMDVRPGAGDIQDIASSALYHPKLGDFL